MFARRNSHSMVFLKDISNKLKGYLFQVSFNNIKGYKTEWLLKGVIMTNDQIRNVIWFWYTWDIEIIQK